VWAQEITLKQLEGLSQSVVNCIIQDHKGFMWFGTQSGLNRYDGYSFTIYKSNPLDSNSLSHNFVNCILEDENGILWIGTDGGGLNTYNPVTGVFRNYRKQGKNLKSLPGDQVKTLLLDTDGVLWVGTNNGLFAFDRATGTGQRYQNREGDRTTLSHDRVTCLALDKQNELWVGTEKGGLNRFNRKSGTFDHFFLDEGNSKGIYSNWVTSLLVDTKGELWIGNMATGLNIFDPKTQQTRTFTEKDGSGLCDERISQVVQSRNGEMWIGTGNGVTLMDPVSRTMKCIREESDASADTTNLIKVKSLYEDNAGNVWIGTSGQGVKVYLRTKHKFEVFRKAGNGGGLSGNMVMCFQEIDPNTVWVGTLDNGITVWDRTRDAFSWIVKDGPEELAHGSIISLLKDSRGVIWVGSYGGGLFSRLPNEKKFRNHTPKKLTTSNGDYVNNKTILCLAEDDKGKVWAGTFNGINIYDPKTQKFTYLTRENGLSDNVVYSIYPARSGKIWIGTLGSGVDVYDPTTGDIVNYAKAEQGKGLSDNSVFSIIEDDKGFIWLATGNGLNRIDPINKEVTPFYEVHGLPSNFLLGLESDDQGNIWISTVDKGLVRFTPAPGKDGNPEIKVYDKDDGLQDNEFNQGAYARLSDGEIIFGGIKGFNSFYPSNLIENNHIPPVYIKSINVLGRKLETDSAAMVKHYIELDWRDAYYLYFEVVGLDYVDPMKNQYRFKLEGFDADWRPEGGKRFAEYTNVKGGHYTFRVQASNSDGLWNEEGASIQIYVQPPFWETEWFYALCIIAFLGGIFAFIQIRTRKIQKEKKVLEGKVAERTRELAQKNKDITSSIIYAQRIQEAILPSKSYIHQYITDAFILYRPKDIVSGDFYWFARRDGLNIIAAVDCTGHGVPGAFMSMIGHNLLNQIVIENGITRPSEILNRLNAGVQKALQQGHANQVETSDGMDVAICCINAEEMEVQFAGAFRPLYYFGKDGFQLIQGNKFPIGGVQMDEARVFSNQKIKVAAGDRIYLFSDGYTDQFGGERGKKFMTKRFRELLEHAGDRPMNEQGKLLEDKFEEWRGEEEQVDDVLVIGIRF
ncbi:MAG: SpoIIE family protein phosphatase, partial [Flavobacteriales bacterium]|nr:SpoIIE family protein phosphatase [Flavobacteriales bacterium]